MEIRAQKKTSSFASSNTLREGPYMTGCLIEELKGFPYMLGAIERFSGQRRARHRGIASGGDGGGGGGGGGLVASGSFGLVLVGGHSVCMYASSFEFVCVCVCLRDPIA